MNGSTGMPCQCLMKSVLRSLNNAIIHIDYFPIHTRNHTRPSQSPWQSTPGCHKHSHQGQPGQVLFGNNEVLYQGFPMAPECTRPRNNKLNAIKVANSAMYVKTICSFEAYAISLGPVFKILPSLLHHVLDQPIRTQVKKGGTIPKEAMNTFIILTKQLTSELIMAFPTVNHHYALVTDVATGTVDSRHGRDWK